MNDVIKKMEAKGCEVKQLKKGSGMLYSTSPFGEYRNYLGEHEIMHLAIVYPDGSLKYIYPDSRPTYIMHNNVKVKTKAEALELCKQGLATAATDMEFYDEFYDLLNPKNAGIRSCLFNGYSLRTANYINEMKKTIGLKSIEFGFDDYSGIGVQPVLTADLVHTFKTSDSKVLDNYLEQRDYKPTDVDTLELPNGEFLAQIEAIVSGAECSFVLKSIFDHFPTLEEVTKTLQIMDIIKTVSEFTEVFTCPKTGKLVHWINIEGTLEYKLYMLTEQRSC